MGYMENQVEKLELQNAELRKRLAAETGDTKNAPEGWKFGSPEDWLPTSDIWNRRLPAKDSVVPIQLLVEHHGVGKWRWFAGNCGDSLPSDVNSGFAYTAFDAMKNAARAAAPYCKCNGFDSYGPACDKEPRLLHYNGPCDAHPDASFSRALGHTGNYGNY